MFKSILMVIQLILASLLGYYFYGLVFTSGIDVLGYVLLLPYAVVGLIVLFLMTISSFCSSIATKRPILAILNTVILILILACSGYLIYQYAI